MAPTLAVCTAVYNEERFLTRALESIVSQSRPPDDYVIIDDGSTDRSPEIIDRFARRYSFIRAIRNPTNQGVLAASNRMIALIKSDYLFGFASDDQVQEGFFAAAMAAAEQHPEAGIIFGDMRTVDEDGKVLSVTSPSRITTSSFLPPDRFREDFLEVEGPAYSASASTMYQSTAYQESGRLHPELGSWADTFVLQTVGLRHGACYIKHVGTNWTQRQQSFSQTARSNPRLLLDIAARSAWLMRSAEYRQDYPEPYVRRWEERFRQWVINDQADQLWHQLLDPFDRQLQSLAPHGRLDRLVVGSCRLLVRLAVKLKNLHSRHKLSTYQGDVSCLTSPSDPASSEL